MRAEPLRLSAEVERKRVIGSALQTLSRNGVFTKEVRDTLKEASNLIYPNNNT